MFGRKRDAEVTEISADQIRELVGDTPKHAITVGVHAKSSAQLGNIAYDIAEFINVLREQTGDTFALDIQAAVGQAPDTVRKTDAIGFLAQPEPDDYEGDPEEEDDEGAGAIGKRK